MGVLTSLCIALIKRVLVCMLYSAMFCKELCVVQTCICCMRSRVLLLANSFAL
jgi:hypothetical protein